MLKKRFVLLGLLLVVSIAGQVLLRPCLGESTAVSAAPQTQAQTKAIETKATNPWDIQTDKPVDPLEKNLTSRLLMMLGFIAAAGVGIWYFFKKMNTPWTGTKNGHLQLVETMHLGPRKAIHIIRAGQKRLLISNSNEGIRLLADLTGTLEVSSVGEEL
jgi:flagellar biogenesis protein FliO